MQAVQDELNDGKVVLILFWNPNATDDQSVHAALRHINTQDGNVAVHVATVGQVADYGTITTAISIAETPTIEIINPKDQASTLTGLVDDTAINQAIADAEQAAGADEMPQLTAFTPGSPRAAYVKRVNRVCTRDIAKLGSKALSPSMASLQAEVAWSAAGLNRILGDVERATPPAADGQYIDEAISHERTALTQYAAAASAMSARKTGAGRTLLLNAQGNDDRAAIMFNDYGLAACIAGPS